MRHAIKVNVVAIAIWFGLGGGYAHALSPGSIDANFANTPFGYVASYGNDAVTSSFTDHYTFTATPPMYGAGALNVLSGFDTIGSSRFQFFGFDVSFDSLELWDTTASTLVATGIISPGEFLGFAGFPVLSAGHSYDIIVSGSLNSLGAGPSAGLGAYGGNIILTPVPEPEKYAMLLVGLGLVGIAARRRRNLMH